MEYIRLGKTNLMVSRVAFGAMRLSDSASEDDAALIVRKAYDSGINLFDTSRKTPESERLLGDSLYDVRKDVFLTTTTDSVTCEKIESDVESSLMTLHCDSIDLLQFETDDFLPTPCSGDGIYETLAKLKAEKKVGHIGLVTTNFGTAKKVIESDIFETLQFPFSMISPEEVIELVNLCSEHDIGFIAMQPLCGGVVENIPLAFGFLRQYESVVPIWGVESMEEMEQILYFNEHPPVIDEKFHEDVERMRMFFN